MHHELPARRDLEHYRKDAKALVRAYRDGVAEAVERAEDVLGERARRRFGLTDAQYVIASEHGHTSWADFRRGVETATPEEPVGRIGLADVTHYEQRAAELVTELQDGNDTAIRRVRAHLPRLAAATPAELAGSALALRDAKVVVAREYGFPTWRQLVFHLRKAIEEAERGPGLARVQGRQALAAGDANRLRELVAEHPGLADGLLEDLTQPDVFGAGLRRDLGVDRGAAQLIVETAGNRDECLTLASCFDRIELMELLLAAGADDESVEIWGVTPLETALYHGSRAAAELLAARRIVPFALWTAASLGRVEVMKSFFDAGGRPRPAAGAHRPDLSKVGWPPGPPPRDDPREVLEEALVHAAHNGRDEAVEWLLDRGVDIDARPYLDVTALHLAAGSGHLSTVRLLLDRGADPELVDGIHGGTPLGWAEYQAEQEPRLRPIRDLLALRSSGPNRARSMPPTENERLLRLAKALEAARSTWGELGEVVLDGGVEYADGDAVEVRVRKRGHRYTVGDDGAAVARAGKPRGWLELAGDVVESYALNVNRRGVVFVPAVEGGLDLAWLALRIADCSAAVYEALLELDGD